MLYIKKSEVRGTLYLECHTPNCKGRFVLKNGDMHVTTAHDDHADEGPYISELKFRQRLREKIHENPEVQPTLLFEQIQAQYPDSLHISFSSVKSLITKTREKQLPPIPKNLEELGNNLQTDT